MTSTENVRLYLVIHGLLVGLLLAFALGYREGRKQLQVPPRPECPNASLEAAP